MNLFKERSITVEMIVVWLHLCDYLISKIHYVHTRSDPHDVSQVINIILLFL